MRAPTILEYIYLQRIKRASGLLTYKQAFINSYKYGEFYASTPILGHFVASTLEGVPLEKPQKLHRKYYKSSLKLYFKDLKEWEEAEKRVKWVGWEPCHVNKQGCYIDRREKISAFAYFESKTMDFELGMGRFEEMKTYEALIKAGVPLEPTEGFAVTMKLK